MSHKLMGILWAHTGDIGYIVLTFNHQLKWDHVSSFRLDLNLLLWCVHTLAWYVSLLQLKSLTLATSGVGKNSN